MRENKKLYIIYTVLFHVLSWVGLIIYGFIKYGALIAGHKIVFMFGIVILLGLILAMVALKNTEDNMIGMPKKICSTVRRLIPLGLGLILMIVLGGNVAGILTLLEIAFGGNILAAPLGILAYGHSKRHRSDVGMLKVLDHIESE